MVDLPGKKKVNSYVSLPEGTRNSKFKGLDQKLQRGRAAGSLSNDFKH